MTEQSPPTSSAAIERMESRSIALHAEIARRLDPALVDAARERVRRWLDERSVAEAYAREWEALLSRPLSEIRLALVRRDDQMAALRQVSPFAGVLSARERWAILRSLRPGSSP